MSESLKADWLNRVVDQKVVILNSLCYVIGLCNEHPSREMAITITKLEEALMWLNRRIELEAQDGEA